MKAARAGKEAKRGRPAHSAQEIAGARREVARAWKDLGRAAGERSVHRALSGKFALRVGGAGAIERVEREVACRSWCRRGM